MKPIWLSVLLLWLGCGPAAAEMMTFDGVRFSLELPKDGCARSRSNPRDEPAYAQQDRMQLGFNTVLLLVSPCPELERVRNGIRPQHFGIWLVVSPNQVPLRVPASMTRAAALTELAAATPKLDLKSILSDVDKAATAEGMQIKMNNIGVIDQDTNAVYVGMVADVSIGDEKRTLAAVLGQTLLLGRVVSFNTYEDFENKGTFDRLLTEAKDVVARTVAATEALPVDRTLPDGMTPIP